MKLVKSLLLGSATGLVAVAGASAADLGVKKPAAVEYVKTCPTYGAGFFVVPGTTSCLKLIGRIRADYLIDNPRLRTDNSNRFRARAYVGFDHRTATEYGLLRTYARVFHQAQNGNGGDATTVEYAFIQFGGITAGRVAPIFEHGWNQFYLSSGQYGYGYHSDAASVNSLGYTANLGGGFSASIALDDPRDRRALTAGAALPDIVASLGLDQSWGSAKLSGAITQNRPLNGADDTKYGYAVEGGVRVNLPFLTKGSNIWVSGSYGSGALSYTGWNGDGTAGIGNYNIDAKGNDFVNGKETISYSAAGALQVFVMPTVAVSLGGFYGQMNPTGASNTVTTYAAIGQVQWSPVAGFIIGAEAAYRKLSFNSGAVGTYVSASSGNSKDDVVGRLRIQRDF